MTEWIFLTVGVLMLVFRDRFMGAMEESGRASARQVGGPLAWWGDPPDGTRRARFQATFYEIFKFAFPLIWIGFAIWAIATD